MATVSQSTIDKGSDMIHDYLCSTCEDKKLDKMADFYCASCEKFYCGKCIGMHNQLFTTHAPFGRGDMKKWPVVKKVEDFLLKCDVHTDENLQMFCNEHSELCCKKCALHKHRHCKKVTLISERVKSQSTDLKKLSDSIQTILKEMKKLQDNQKAGIRSVQCSYDEQLHTIQETRQKINAALDTIEQKTLIEIKDTLIKLQADTKSNVNKCARFRDELHQLRDAIQDISDKSKRELLFIATWKCKDKIQQSETFLKENSLQGKVSISFHPNNDIVQYLSKLSGLGRIEPSAQNPNKVFTVQGMSVHNVNVSSDASKCNITAICVLDDGQVLVADSENKNVKLLNQLYQVVNNCGVTASPFDICQITSAQVAVILDDPLLNQIQFITVNNSQLLIGRTLNLELNFQHTFRGIAFHQGDLYIAAGTALYKYTLSGKQVSRVYENTSGYSLWKCAVSPTGDKLYITNTYQNELLTLAMNGSVLATFTDPALIAPYGVHVAPAGQVLVCGGWSHTIIHVDTEGRRKLTTLATQEDDMVQPYAVCYNRHTASIIVGLSCNNCILVFKVQ